MAEKHGMSKFRLVPNTEGRGYRLFLNGVDISAGVQEIDFSFSLKAGGKPKIHLAILGDVEIPEELLTEVTIGKEE